jgi:hypothetical protein
MQPPSLRRPRPLAGGRRLTRGTLADLAFPIRTKACSLLGTSAPYGPYTFYMANATLFAAAAILTLLAGPSPAAGQTLDKLQLHKVRAVAAEYRGSKAIHLTQLPDAQGEDTLAIIAGPVLQDGAIEVDLAGAPAPGAFGDARGFIGVAFRVQPNAAKFPDWPWQRTRKETPGLYESYTDLEPGVWTKVKIVLAGAKARLYVHGAEQPCLIVNDLKLLPAKGAIGLWTGPGTDGYFANLRVTPQE